MQRKLAPGILLVGALIMALLFAGLCIKAAVSRPWLGLDLGIQADTVIIEKVEEGHSLAGNSGAKLLAIGTPGSPAVALEPEDLVEEPDTLGDSTRLRRFYDRQAQLDTILRSEQVLAVIENNGRQETITAVPAPSRPVSDLPWQFWTQLFVGVVGWTLGAWVVALRPNDTSAWMLLVAGLGLSFAAQAAAIYSTRELALDFETYAVVSRINGFGTLLFGVGMVTLFLIYPKRLVRGIAIGLPAIAIGAGAFYMIIPGWPGNVPLLQPFVALIMVVLLVAIAEQFLANRRDPAARAMLGWLGLSVVLGAGGFVLTVIIPPLLGRPTVIEQSTAFLLFLIIYIGVALGVTRYRLFDLADWSIGVLSYAIGVVLLLVLDALLIYGLALDQLPALSVSLAVVCLIYLPLRNRIAEWPQRGMMMPMEELYRLITEISHLPESKQQVDSIKALWGDIFHPLAIRQTTGDEIGYKSPAAPTLADDGRTLFLPAGLNFPAFRLDYAGQGARLFSSRDTKQAATIVHLLDDTLGRHRAYRQAVEAERTRINRDMHDNIGILLLGALHNPDTDRKNSLIRQTLSDLREIVSNPMQEPLPLRHLIADLRAELGEAMEAAGVALRWEKSDLPDIEIPTRTIRLLQAFLREGVSNILRHSGAQCAVATVDVAEGQISATLWDNGPGFDVENASLGNGLKNLRSRMLQSSGTFVISSSASGTRVSASVPLDLSRERRMA
ncbi:ATPase [Pseudotabrizicola sp. 4114]|uniref:ATPase n=1 Tax=Pseudotabrizicola sp. 4114 TaxID=2817731 RepID=UPI0028589F71|nr:signal transduction histidine kinase [Pseudorhodobacter sp. 4114]